MNAIDLLALASFAVLVLSWAILPAGIHRSEHVKEAETSVAFTPVHESR